LIIFELFNNAVSTADIINGVKWYGKVIINYAEVRIWKERNVVLKILNPVFVWRA
jgi:hypothetical protein